MFHVELAPLGGILDPLKSDLGVFWAKIPLSSDWFYNVKTQKTLFLQNRQAEMAKIENIPCIMHPAYIQLVAKCSSPSICDARATGCTQIIWVYSDFMILLIFFRCCKFWHLIQKKSSRIVLIFTLIAASSEHECLRCNINLMKSILLHGNISDLVN